MIERQISELAGQVTAGNHLGVSRAISMCEAAGIQDAKEQLVGELWPHTGQAETVGVTGPPGVGKSTLISKLISHARAEDRTVGLVAVDPSSPDSGGALLGDRIRMDEHMLDSGVFIRSMSAGGNLGGVAEATFLAMTVLDAAGKDLVIVETVGVGQSEIEVRYLADTVIVALQPESGDAIQAMKSGLMEIPDVLCLNKTDLPNADAAHKDLAAMLNLTEESERPFLVTAQAEGGKGIDTLWEKIQAHRDRLGETGLRERRRRGLSRQVAAIAASRVTVSLEETLREASGRKLLDSVAAQTMDPLRAAEELRRINVDS
jgi:LAO/AO transport system kinase